MKSLFRYWVIGDWSCTRLLVLWASQLNRYIIFCNIRTERFSQKPDRAKADCSYFIGIHRNCVLVSALWTKRDKLHQPTNSPNNSCQQRVCTIKGEDCSFSRKRFGNCFIDYWKKGTTITCAYYASLLDSLKIELQQKRPWTTHKENSLTSRLRTR